MPWEVPTEALEQLLSKYERCIKEAIRVLDNWFNDNTWSRMPTSVKLITISFYCKIGFEALNDQKTKDFMSMKTSLEVVCLYCYENVYLFDGF
jgi:hypothetical protein